MSSTRRSLKRLSAFSDFIDSLDLEDLGEGGQAAPAPAIGFLDTSLRAPSCAGPVWFWRAERYWRFSPSPPYRVRGRLRPPPSRES